MNGLESRDTGSDLVESSGEENIGASVRFGTNEPFVSLSRVDEVPLELLTPKQAEAMRRLGEIAQLPFNWDSYGSPPPTSTAINLVMDFLWGIDDRNLPSVRVVPVAGGGVQLEWDVSGRELQLEIKSDGVVQYLHVENGRPVREEELHFFSMDQIRHVVSWLTPPRTSQRWAA